MAFRTCKLSHGPPLIRYVATKYGLGVVSVLRGEEEAAGGRSERCALLQLQEREGDLCVPKAM